MREQDTTIFREAFHKEMERILMRGFFPLPGVPILGPACIHCRTPISFMPSGNICVALVILTLKRSLVLSKSNLRRMSECLKKKMLDYFSMGSESHKALRGGCRRALHPTQWRLQK